MAPLQSDLISLLSNIRAVVAAEMPHADILEFTRIALGVQSSAIPPTPEPSPLKGQCSIHPLPSEKIPCIKALREVSGLGLKEAKEVTEGVAVTLTGGEIKRLIPLLAEHGVLFLDGKPYAADVTFLLRRINNLHDSYKTVEDNNIGLRRELIDTRDALVLAQNTIRDRNEEINTLTTRFITLKEELTNREKQLGVLTKAADAERAAKHAGLTRSKKRSNSKK